MLRHRQARSDKPPPQTGRFDQPCGQTVPSGNLGPMQQKGTAPHLLETPCEMMLLLLWWARPAASSLIFSWRAAAGHSLRHQSLNTTSTQGGSKYAGSQAVCEFVLPRVSLAWRGRVGTQHSSWGEPGCRIHMPQGTGLPLAPGQVVSGLGPRPSSWDPSLGSFLPEIQSRA